MRIQDFMADGIEKRQDTFFKLAHTVPEDKLDWKPGGEARSILDQLQEIALIHRFHGRILKARQMPEFDPASFAKYQEERKALTTVAACEASANEHTSTLTSIIRDYPDEDLSIRAMLPFNGGMDLSMAEVMQLVYWNLSYHEGQIQFILNLHAEAPA